jgi:molybdate transport system regulatory protein
MPPRKSHAPRLRILFGDAIAIGPGKADLLDAIAETGSIAAGGRRLGMSYRRAWLLVETMNRSFTNPLVTAAKGGQRGGGAHLTATGVDVLARYRAMEARAEQALAADMATFSALLKARRPRK